MQYGHLDLQSRFLILQGPDDHDGNMGRVDLTQKRSKDYKSNRNNSAINQADLDRIVGFPPVMQGIPKRSKTQRL